MGAKITVDSATMANKGLEVIEAVRLFNLPPEKVKVVIHPQSVVHSMIRMKNGAVYAQLSRPDMRLPIETALYFTNEKLKVKNEKREEGFGGEAPEFPEEGAHSQEGELSVEDRPSVKGGGFGRLDFDSLSLEFYRPDTEKFPLLALAYDAVKKGGLYPCAYNGANEAAVAAFLEGRIGFLDIGRVTGYVLERDWGREPGDIASVLEADIQVKKFVEEEIKC
jgi:1-deoxy-D-xylulose-5-phosphate reductoisomerase